MKKALIPNPSAEEDAVAVIPLADNLKKTAMGGENKSDEKGTVSSEPKALSVTKNKIADDKSSDDATNGRKKQKKKENKKAKIRPLTMPVTSKDALMVLNELKGVTVDNMQIKRDHEGKIMARVVVNSKKYEAEGSSVNSARNAACEKALQEILTTKMKAVMDGQENSLESDEDDILEKMASYAIYKLGKEWKTDDIDVPALYNDLKNKQTSVVEPKKQLPETWKNMHPCMVLNYMRPQCTFIVSGGTGTNQNNTFSMSVCVDNCEFNAEGPSKKAARYKLSALVCNKLFGTDYPQK